MTAPSASAQTLYNSLADYNAAATTTRQFDFEGIALVGGVAYFPNSSSLTVSVSGADDPGPFAVSGTFSGGGFSLNGSDTLVAAGTDGSTPTVTIHFGSTVTAFGTEFGFRYFNVPYANSFTAQLFNGTTPVGSSFSSVAIFGSPTFSTGFFGVTSDVAFDRITISNPFVQTGYQVYDNIRLGSKISTAAPEPGSVALLGIVALPLLARRMRRK